MDDVEKKEYLEEFKKADGAKRLDMWDYALQQQVLWESIISEMQNIAKQLGIDKKLDDMTDEEMKKDIGEIEK